MGNPAGVIFALIVVLLLAVGSQLREEGAAEDTPQPAATAELTRAPAAIESPRDRQIQTPGDDAAPQLTPPRTMPRPAAPRAIPKPPPARPVEPVREPPSGPPEPPPAARVEPVPEPV